MISILGCGWLGMPLAIEFINSGKSVKGSTTRTEKLEEIRKYGITPYLVQLSDINNEILSFLENEILIINVPPGRNKTDFNSYSENFKNLISYINLSAVNKVIFVSSTSVYKENDSFVTEDSDISSDASAQRLFNTEELFRNQTSIKTTIIRFSGLIGPNRHPGRFFSGKQNIANGASPINLIHLDDCIGIIKWVIENNVWGETINASAPQHPTKQEFYSKATEVYDGSQISFIDENSSFKIINCNKLENDLKYKFKYPGLMEWLNT